MSNKKLLKSDEIARIVASVELLAGDSVAHDGAAVVKNDDIAASILLASDTRRVFTKDEKAIVLNKYAHKIEYRYTKAKVSSSIWTDLQL